MATLVPDNLKAGVITHTQTTIRLSRAIMEVASYHQLFVEPTRVRRPRDKAKVDSRRWECEQLVDSDLAEVAGCRKIQ